MDRSNGQEALLLACCGYVNLRRRTPQPQRAGFFVCAASSAVLAAHWHAGVSGAAAPRSAFPGACGVLERASAARPSKKSASAGQLPAWSIAKHRAVSILAGDQEGAV